MDWTKDITGLKVASTSGYLWQLSGAAILFRQNTEQGTQILFVP